MTLIEVVILAGAQCLSPIAPADGVTEVGKVPCAVVVKLDQDTGEVQFKPAAAATDPRVVAMLMKPGEIGATADAANENLAPNGGGTAEADAAPPKPVARAEIMPASDEQPEVQTGPPENSLKNPDRVSGEKPNLRKAETAPPRKRRAAARRTDSCGSYRAVWYTNKEGRRKYRCVRQG